jgi:hypothetical protein
MTTARGGRAIGQRIRQVCDAVERAGSGNSNAIAAATTLPSAEVARYAGRAERRGLLLIDRSTWPHTYRPVHGWRGRVDCDSDRIVAETPMRALASVFDLGTRALEAA